MIARCWVCGWESVSGPLAECGAALRAHAEAAQHPRVWCPDCERDVPTHGGRFPTHFRDARTPGLGIRPRLLKCDWSGEKT
jgi:hypothetical protein